jgi:hypothetical protein
MADQLQLRRGTTAQIAAFTGAQGEVIVDTDKDTLVVQDGVTAGGFPLASAADLDNGTYQYSDDTGGGSAANAYILVPQANTNVPSTYLGGIIFSFVTANANTGPSTANFQMLGVKNIKLPGGIDPAAGDISGRVTVIYDAVNGWLELQRKATGAPPQIRTIGGTVSANALTVTLAPCTLEFRSATGSSGAVTSINTTSTLSLTIPSGATIGTANATESRIAILAINNAGVVELAAINVSGAPQLQESSLITTVAIDAASDSASVFYSAAARAAVPYRVVGVIVSTQASAGVWATTPSTVQGQGGQALINAAPIPLFTAEFQSTPVPITLGGAIVVAHPLGIVPKTIDNYLYCSTAEAGWSIGDLVGPLPYDSYAGGGFMVTAKSATQVDLRAAVTRLNYIVNKATGANATLTPANWRHVAIIRG